MKKIKNKDIIFFMIILSISFIIFIPFLAGHYATDTYNIANVGYENYAIQWSFNDGRIFMGLIGLLQNQIQLPIEVYVSILTMLAITISCMTVIFVKNRIAQYQPPKNKGQEILLLIICYTIIFNFMYVENLYFVECLVMAISLFCYMATANQITQKTKRYGIKSLFFMIVGILCYQGTIGIVFAMTALFSILKNKNNKKQILIDLIQSGLFALLAVCVNMLVVKGMGILFQTTQTRMGNMDEIFNNFSYILRKTSTILIQTCGLYPRNWLVFGIVVTLLLSIFYERKSKEKNLLTAKTLFLIFITIASGCVIFLMTLTSFYAGRLRFCIGALLGIVFALLYGETKWFEKTNGIQILATILVVLFFLSNLGSYVFLMQQHKQVNKQEKQEVAKIEQDIVQYEQNTGHEIQKVAIITVTGETNKAYFQNIPNYSVLTYNALSCNWSADGVFNFYTRRKLETIQPTQEEKQEYEKRKPKDKEYVCIEDTLYITAYMY